MKNFKWMPALGLMVIASIALTGCGSGDKSSSANVRLLNATLTHPSLDLLVNSAAAVSAVATDTVSNYVSPSSGSVVLQINDNGQSTALTTIAPTIGNGAHVTIVAYEVSGVVRTTVLPEDSVLPASGAAAIRVLDSATDAGGIDVYVAAPGTSGSIPDLSPLAPTVSFSAQTFVELLPDTGSTLTPGTYEIVVTGQGNKADVRADIKNVVLASTQLGLIVLTPASGGVLVNGVALVQQTAGFNVSGRNTNARVRFASGAAGGATFTATVAGQTLDAGKSPYVGTYSLVAAATPLTVTTGTGVAVNIPALSAGSDNTLLLTGTSASPLVNLLTDDNHLPPVSTSTVPNVKVRVVNGLTGANSSPLTMSFNYSTFAGAGNVAPGAASSYGVQSLPASGLTTINLTTTNGADITSLSNLSLSGNSVYSVFVLGDGTTVTPLPRLDR